MTTSTSRAINAQSLDSSKMIFRALANLLSDPAFQQGVAIGIQTYSEDYDGPLTNEQISQLVNDTKIQEVNDAAEQIIGLGLIVGTIGHSLSQQSL